MGVKKMTKRLAAAALVPVPVVFALLALAQEGEPEQPNILVIISDDQGVVDSPEYHYDPNPPHTPVLSALANEGVIFENAWATPMCFTTRAAYLTGLHGARNGVLTGGVPIRLEDQTIYEFLSDNDDTLIIFSGDNGSSEPTVIQDRQAKSTLYAGGLHVPFFASGAGVTRKGVREDRLVTITDIFATVGEIAGADFDGSIHDSVSFAGFLASEEGIDRPYAFSDIDRNATSGWSVRDHEHMLMRLNGEDTLLEINPDNFMYKDVTASEPEILRRLQQAGERIHRGD